MSNKEIRERLLAMKSRVCDPARTDALRKRLEATPNRIDFDAMKRLCEPSSPFYGMSRMVSEETE